MKIGLLVIATGKYIKFIAPLSKSVKINFLKNHEITMFIFTDSEDFKPQNNQIVIRQPHLPWPKPTLYRYDTFKKNEALLKEMDYLFYCDADMLVVDTVSDEILSDLVGTCHPGYYNKPRHFYTYETNPQSKAYIAPNEGVMYYAGGFNGGKTEHFFKLINTCAQNIKTDEENGIIAVWHDESHMNRYFVDNPPTLKLNPSYCYPESSNIPFHKRIIALDKNHQEMRAK